MKILGIDPGSVLCGWGLIESEGQNFRILEYGIIKASLKSGILHDRMTEIFRSTDAVIKRWQPEKAVFETVFYSKNAQSLMKLSHARASAILACTLAGLEIAEYSPRAVKKAVTGNGNASKEQVGFMVRKLLGIKEKPEFEDSTDALAVAISYVLKGGKSETGKSSWNQFIKNNPGRISGI